NGPVEHCASDPFISSTSDDTNSFDLPSFRATPRKTRNEGQLKGPNDVSIAFSDAKELIGIGIYIQEGFAVRGKISDTIFACSAEFIVGQHSDDCREVSLQCFTKY